VEGIFPLPTWRIGTDDRLRSGTWHVGVSAIRVRSDQRRPPILKHCCSHQTRRSSEPRRVDYSTSAFTAVASSMAHVRRRTHAGPGPCTAARNSINVRLSTIFRGGRTENTVSVLRRPLCYNLEELLPEDRERAVSRRVVGSSLDWRANLFLSTFRGPFVNPTLRPQLRKWQQFRQFRVSPFRAESRLQRQTCSRAAFAEGRFSPSPREPGIG
jgi:hypothetical protein